MLPAALYLWFTREDVRAVVALAEILALWLAVAMRNSVVAIKYAYLDKGDIEDQYDSSYEAPLRIGRRIFMAGWASPTEVDSSVLTEEMNEAQARSGCVLSGALVKCRPAASAKELEGMKPAWAGDVTAEGTQPPPAGYLQADILLSLITDKTLAAPFPGHRRAMMIGGFLLPFLPPLVRALGPGDVPAFGNTSASKIVCAFCVYAPGLYVALMAGYSQVAMWSYLRRGRAMALLDELCGEGGCSTERFSGEMGKGVGAGVEDSDFGNGKHIESPSNASRLKMRKQQTYVLKSANKVAIDLTDPTTVVSVLLLRRCLRQMGVRYNKRVDGFTIAFFATGVVYVFTLCVFFLRADTRITEDIGPLDHRLSTDLLLVAFALYTSAMLALLVLTASHCNEAPRFRACLQRAALNACAELVDIAAAGDDNEIDIDAAWRRASAKKALLQMADAQVGYNEEVVEPVTVLGNPATPIAVGATISAIATGMGLALQGFVSQQSEGWGYSKEDGLWRGPT
ncbi:hypothetical protein TrST_g4415 [Triparma strigata]|nr:hypothetical protein TrST_g4415 [Triparma strigata]